MCLDIDSGPNSDPRIGQTCRFGGSAGSAGSVDNESASYLPISLRRNSLAPYSANGELSGELSVRTSHWVSADPARKQRSVGRKVGWVATVSGSDGTSLVWTHVYDELSV